MTPENLSEPLKVGTLVNLPYTDYSRAKIVEYLGPLGPKGARIYRLLVQTKPRREYMEVREDQLEILENG
jgi:hypothetical protein